MTFRNGITGRGYSDLRAGRKPLLHAWTGQRASKYGRNHRALCGGSLAYGAGGQYGLFDPAVERSCRECAKVLEQRRRESP